MLWPVSGLIDAQLELRIVRIFLLATVVAVGLAGCQTTPVIPANAEWVNAKNPNADRQRDRNECEREAVKEFPASVSSSGGADTQGSCTGVGYTTACTSSAGMIKVDSNSGRRDVASRKCMRERGWRPMVNGVDVDPDK